MLTYKISQHFNRKAMYSFQNVLEESGREHWTICQDSIKPEITQSVNVK